MHFPTFTVAATNIFPISNSTKGGQLVTEYNLRAREMVGTDPAIEYEVGPSYVHSARDFSVSLLSGMEAEAYDPTASYTIGQYVTYNSVTYACKVGIDAPAGPFDGSNWVVVNSSSCILQIAPGRAVINGHYVETLSPMTIDLTLANAQLAQSYSEPLIGELSIGIKSYYSTESTMAGSLLIENEDNTYTGIQLVIEKRDNFKTPSNTPTDRSQVTADIKLADFIYINGVITGIVQNSEKVAYVHPSRISDMSTVLDNNYVSKKNLNAHKLYTFSGQGGDSDKSTWCDSTGSLMVWDSQPTITLDNPNDAIPQATFLSTADGYVHLAVPHQQIDSMKNGSGQNIYYNLRDIKLPKANYLSGAPGTVDASYTQVIKNLADKLSGLKQSPAGNMVLWLEVKDSSYVMPTIPTSYNNGDYIFVREDMSARLSEDEGAAPSTMYKVIPGMVANVAYSQSLPSGVRLGDTAIDVYATTQNEHTLTAADLTHLTDWYDESHNYAKDDYATYNGGLYIAKSATTGTWDSDKWTRIFDNDALTLFGYTSYRGTLNSDYFEINFIDEANSTTTQIYYKVTGCGPRAWSDYILVTGGVPLATTVQAGGFYNVDSTATDGGYITLDESGRLKLIDYELLRQGTLAYQLGEDLTLPTNVTSDVVQTNLNQYVNTRVAFPFSTVLSGTTPMINIYITLPAESEETTISIFDIDSRFGTGVYLHFLGNPNSNTIVNIIDCEKIRIDSNIGGNPVINVVRCGIFYDANVFNYIRTCDINNVRSNGFTGLSDITLWYDKFDSSYADLQVNGMEVSQPSATLAAEEIAFWNQDNPNDNHYSSALRSITLDGNGDIIGCSLYVANGSTATNVTTGKSIIGGTFNLPQGSDLIYPIKCLVKPLKVTGSFTSAYKVQDQNWVVMATNFTALTGIYNSQTDVTSSGTIGFYCDTSLLDSQNMTMDINSMDCWEPGEYHIFYGGSTI